VLARQARQDRRPHGRRLDRGVDSSNAAGWAHARDVVIVILGWLAITGVVLWAIGHLTTALLLLILGGLLAYVLTPAVAFLSRYMPRWLGIVVVYLIMLALLGSLGYGIVSTAVAQLAGLSKTLPTLLETPNAQHPSPIFNTLHRLGMSDAQIEQGRQQILSYLQGAAATIAAQAVPILTGVAGALVDIVLIIVISIYLVIDGPSLVRWLRENSPLSQRQRVQFALDVLGTNVGGYVRGELLLATLIGVLVGGGMFAFHVPYALLLGVVAFVLEFIPILGVFISGTACVLVALTQGVWIAIGVLAYFVGIHVIEGDIVGPRIIGRVLGLHPVLAIVALITGADLFGFWGALFAAPVAGVIQSTVVALWTEWRDTHPEEFPPPIRDQYEQHQDQQLHQPQQHQQPVGTSSE
jgi:predicted PurR-regulated permease PerM